MELMIPSIIIMNLQKKYTDAIENGRNICASMVMETQGNEKLRSRAERIITLRVFRA